MSDKEDKQVDRVYTVYTDGVYDVFHRGHVESLRICKQLFPNTRLVVGVIGDEVATGYKREPIYKEDDRFTIIENIRFVDEVVRNPPLIITEDFLNKYGIDYVVHGFSNPSDADKQDDFFKIPQQLGKFKVVPYYDKISTSDIISRIKLM